MHQPRRETNTFEVHSTLQRVENQNDFLTKDFLPYRRRWKRWVILTLIYYCLRERLTEFSGRAAISDL